MTGKPFCKTRTITSERLISPLAGKRDLNDAAISFKSAVHESISRPTLNVGLSIKALESASGNETYKDTDGKKRTNSGGTPGMVETPNGYRYDPNQKWEDGKVLKLFPSIKSRKSAIKEPNFGWIDKEPSITADEYAKELAKKPQLRIRKYKVNKKTDEIIPESEQLLDPFSLSGGTKSESADYQVKRLPGRTIGQRGRSLVARAASSFGLIVDENGKFRCPPGTPAANQYTDTAGTNCFGISASEIFDFAKKLASGMDVDSDAYTKNSTKKLFQFISWLDNGGIPGLGRTVWRDQDGNKIRNIRKWREVRKTESGRVFVDGMIRGQDKLAQQDIAIASLMDVLGVVRTDEKRKTNDDVFEVFEKLRESGAWTIDTSTRLSPEDVDTIVRARLAHVPGFSDLSPERQKKLIEADTERWYTTERALLEGALDSFIADPEHMRTISKINFEIKNPNGKSMDEASTEGFTAPDSKRVMSIINVDIPEIMNNQEAMIPSLAPNERIKIDFTGGRTDSESGKALTDFLVTVDGHSKQLAAMVEERAFARHIMKHEIAHTIQMQAFNREAERQIRTYGFITVLNNKGEPVRVENIRDLTSEMVMSLMAKASDGIDLESLKNALSRTDVVGFLAGDYPKMYFNDEYGAEHWALEAAAELWALRDLGLIYGDDIDAALEWMDDVSDGRYLDIRRRSDADGLREIEARFYENRGPDPELSGNSIAEVKARLDLAHKKEMSLIEDWSNNSSTTTDDFIDALAGLEYRREAYNDAFDNLEATGESKDSPGFKELNRKIKENNAKIALIEKKWAERFSSEDKDRRRSDVKKMRESVREKMFSEGILRPDEMAARSRQQEIKDLKRQAEDMTLDEFVQKLADIEISLKEPGLSADAKSVLLEDKKMIRAIFKSKLEGSDDAKVWSKQRRELDTRIDEIVNPPREQALKKTKKVKTDKSGASYARKIQKDESYAMTEEQAAAVERLGDPAMTDIGNLVDPDGNVSAVKNINRRYRRAQRSAGDLSPESETAALEDQIEKVLIPAMEAMDESSIPDDLEIEAEIYFGVTNSGFKDVSDVFDSKGFVTGRIITDESPHKPGESRDANGEVITRAGKEKTRVIVQVSKGDKGLFRTNETILGDEGALVLPPGKMKVVDVRPDGTIVLRVQEQDNVVDVLNRVSSSIGEEGPGASQHAKGTKKKIDRVANKYVAQRKENGLSSTPSRPKRDVEIEDKNVAVKREVIKAGGSFGEPPSEDYIAEIGKVPLVQPAEADIKDVGSMYEARTGKKYRIGTSRSDLTLDELMNERAGLYRELLDPDFLHEDEQNSFYNYIGPINSIDKELAERGEIVTNLPQPPEFDYPYEPGQKKRLPYQTSTVKVPLVQPDEADIKPEPVDPRTGRTLSKLKGNMTVDELVNRRAAIYRSLLDPDFANDQGGFQGQDRATLKSIDEELVKRGEIISNLPKPADLDPNYKPGSKKKAPYKTSSGSTSDPTSGREVLGIPQTREQRKAERTTRANMTLGDVKRILAGESPKEVMNDMSRDSLDPAVADEIARKSPEALIKDIEDAAIEFHAGVDKRPRVRMTESQLTKFANDGEFLATGTDDIVLESGAIGRRLERRINPRTRREAPKLSSGAKYEKIVKNQPRPSAEQVEASRDFSDLVKLSEFSKEDVWEVTGKDDFGDDIEELVESEDRKKAKEDITRAVEKIFANEIELDRDIIVESSSGEKINLGKKMKVSVVVEEITVQTMTDENIKEQEDALGQVLFESSATPVTQISIKMKFAPSDEAAAAKLVESGLPESLIDPEGADFGISDGYKNISLELGYARRTITTNGDRTIIGHDSIFIGKEARKYGIASAVNARNESLYTQIGADLIFTQGQSSSGADQTGATHWARNGFTWMNETSKQDFISVIDAALTNTPEVFSDEERQRISSLYKKGSNGKFVSSASAEDLVDFAGADGVFASTNEGDGKGFYFKRDLAQPSGIDSVRNRTKRSGARERVSMVSPSFSSGKRSSAREFAKKEREFWEKMFPDRTEDEWKEVEQQIALDDMRIMGGRALPTAESSLAKMKENSEKAQSRVEGLENAIDILKRTGDWRGEEFGVVITTHPDWKGDAGKFDADTPPVNITKEEIEKRFGSVEFLLNLAEEKLEYSKKEIVLAEHLAKSKEVRVQQNTLDIEDLSPEEFQILLDEYESLTPEDYGGAVIHVGQAELDGGILDPTRTSGGADVATGDGNTGALNEKFISNLKRDNDRLIESLSSAESIFKSFNDGETSYTPKDMREAAYLNKLFGTSSGGFDSVEFEEGIEYDLTQMNRTGALSKIDSELEFTKSKIKKNEQTFEKLEGGGKFGFISSYPASSSLTTSGYFGRNAGSVIPGDVAKYRTQVEAKASKRPQYDDVKDRSTFDRWMSSLRGSAYLVTDPSVITSGLGESGETQILGKVKPVFAVSAPVRGHNPLTSERARNGEWGNVASALIARAIRLEKEGIEVTPASVLGARKGKPLSDFDSSSGKLSSGARNKVKKRGGLIDRFLLENREVGEEARSLRIDTSSISKPTAMDRDEFFRVVGDVPGISDADELLATEKITSSRVSGLEMFRGTYSGEQGEKNRVFGRYSAPNGKEYSIAQDSDGVEGIYYAYQGDERLPESERVARLVLRLNDGELNVHDLFNVDVDEDERKSGIAQAMVEVAKADFPDASFTARRVLTADGANFARNLQGSRRGSSSGSRLSSGKRGEVGTPRRVAGVAGSRATGRILDAVLKRSGADEDTRERVKYGMNMAGALAAGGPAGFATALAVDVSRRAGREIAERGLEEAVQRGKITQQQMDVAMQAVNRVAPNGLPDPVVDKLADAWSVASDFIDERVATGENMQRLDEFGDAIRSSGSEFITNAGEVAGSAREKIGKKLKKIKKKKKNSEDGMEGGPDLQKLRESFGGGDGVESGPDLADLRARFGLESTPSSSEFDDFSDPFSSGKRAGRSADTFRGEYNSRIGISKNTPNSSKPVSGYVVHRSHNEEKKRQIAASGKGNIGSDAIFEVGDNDVVGDGLTALGEIEVILKPEVSDRTSYGRGEALQSAHRPVSMNSSDSDDIADALFNADGISSKEQNAEAMLHLLGAKMDKNFSSVGASRDENGKMSPVGMVDSGTRGHEPFEAQILGGFKKNEVEGIHYPYSKVSKIAESEDISDVVNQNSMKSKLEKMGFTPEEIAYFYSMSGGKPINTASMTKLKEYRAAKKIKEQYEGMGIGYVKFAHPQGINIENPRSYDKTANQNARVDEILRKAIDVEIDAELKKTLDSIRKGQQLDLVVD